MTISNPNTATNAPFYLQTPTPSVAIFKPKMSIFTDTAHFCWVITRHFYGLVKFCWHSIFCWLDQRLNVYSRIQHCVKSMMQAQRSKCVPMLLTETRCRSKSTHDKQSVSVGSKYVVDPDTDTAYFCWVITRYLCGLIKFCWHSIFCQINWFLLRQQILHTQLSIVESSSGILITQQIFADTAYFCWISSFRWLVKFFADTAYFCWVITTILCGLIKFCWHSIFCRISWFLLRQQIFAYTDIYCRLIIRHFDNSASFCWHSVFSLN